MNKIEQLWRDIDALQQEIKSKAYQLQTISIEEYEEYRFSKTAKEFRYDQISNYIGSAMHEVIKAEGYMHRYYHLKDTTKPYYMVTFNHHPTPPLITLNDILGINNRTFNCFETIEEAREYGNKKLASAQRVKNYPHIYYISNETGFKFVETISKES